MDKKAQGKKNRQTGAVWETRVRKELTEEGWNVGKFQNNIYFDKDPEGVMLPSKRAFNPFNRAFTIGTGFPDFICWKINPFEIIAVEAKVNGYLDKAEKKKCEWLIKNKVFKKILIAKKTKEGRKVVPVYTEFKVKK